MTNDELIIFIDKYLNFFKKKQYVFQIDFAAIKLTTERMELVLSKMEKFGIIVVNKTITGQKSWELTPLGHEVVNFGSWTKYQKHLHDKKLNDARNSEYLVLTRWWPLVISGLALIISIGSFVLSLYKETRRELKSPQERIEHESQGQENPISQDVTDSSKVSVIDSLDKQKEVK